MQGATAGRERGISPSALEAEQKELTHIWEHVDFIFFFLREEYFQ